MNPVFTLVIIIVVGLEITFIPNIIVNLAIIIISAGLIFSYHRLSLKALIALIISPLLPAIGTFISQLYFGQLHVGIVIATRIYAYVWMGSGYVLTTNVTQLINTLEQKVHLPTKFIYGVYGALNLLPQTVKAVKNIRTAALMRGIKLSFWSPELYFKAILKALRWSEDLEAAMHSHGFIEDAPRTHAHRISIHLWEYLVTIIAILIIPILRIWS